MTPAQEESASKLTPCGRLERLKGYMEASWGDLADALGVGRQVLLRVRNGERNFSPTKLHRLTDLEREAGLLPDASGAERDKSAPRICLAARAAAWRIALRPSRDGSLSWKAVCTTCRTNWATSRLCC